MAMAMATTRDEMPIDSAGTTLGDLDLTDTTTTSFQSSSSGGSSSTDAGLEGGGGGGGGLGRPVATRTTSLGLQFIQSQLGLKDMATTSSGRARKGAAQQESPPSPDGPLDLAMVALHLSDLVQMTVHTLVRLVPISILGASHEQYSASSISVPTTVLTSVYTMIKRLNWVATNLPALVAPEGEEEKQTSGQDQVFDLGELVQVTADTLAGMAAENEIDLVILPARTCSTDQLFARGDESAVRFAVINAVKMILATVRRGGCVELDLECEAGTEAKLGTSEAEAGAEAEAASPSPTLQCRVSITKHEPATTTVEVAFQSKNGEESMTHSTDVSVEELYFSKRLLHQVHGRLDTQGVEADGCQTYLLALDLKCAHPPRERHPLALREEMELRQLCPHLEFTREPADDELRRFAESLKGRTFTLFAKMTDRFPQHLHRVLQTLGVQVTHGDASSECTMVIIDDDLPILEHHLRSAVQYTPRAERPALHHRRSRSYQASRKVDIPEARPPPPILHFTSLANYRPIKTLVLGILGTAAEQRTGTGTGTGVMPEILIVPKPVGSRRLLTSLHSALTKPTLDPYLEPIATSPGSPSIQTPVQAARQGQGRLSKLDSPRIYDFAMASQPAASTAGTTSSEDLSPLNQERDLSPGYFGHVKVDDVEASAAGVALRDDEGRPAGILFSPRAAQPERRSPGSRKERRERRVSAAPGTHVSSVQANGGLSAHRSHSGLALDSSLRSGSGQSAAALTRPFLWKPRVLSNGPSLMQMMQHDAAEQGASTSRPQMYHANSAPVISGTTSSTSPRKSRISMASASPSIEGQATPRAGTPSAFARHEASANEEAERASSSQERRDERSAAKIDKEIAEVNATRPIDEQTPPSSNMNSVESIDSTTSIASHLTTATQGTGSTASETDDAPAGPLPTTAGTGTPTTPSARETSKGKEGAPKIADYGRARTRAQEAGKAVGPSPLSQSIVPPINVLIVEDNPINQRILTTFLKKRRIEYSVANNGQEAVDKCKEGAFHLVLMDIQLPVKDGIQATKEIRQYEKAQNIGVFPLTPSSDMPQPILATSMTELQARRTKKDKAVKGGAPTVETVAPVAVPATTTAPAADAAASSAVPAAASDPLPTPFRSPVIIVALTASSLSADRHTALAAGCNDFLTKPVSFAWLERKIIEWGCMQALIDFEGWRRWRGGTEATDRAASATGGGVRNVAERLRIERTGSGLVGRRSRLKESEDAAGARAIASAG